MEHKIRLKWGLIGLFVGLACFAILLRQVDLKQAWHALGRLNGPYLLVPFLVFLLNTPLRAWRWQHIFPVRGRPPFFSCLTVLGIGNMANFLLPGRAGDLARCVLGAGDVSVAGSSRTLATLALEKVLDGLALVGVVLVSAWALQPPHWVIELVRVAALVFGGALLSLVLLRCRTGLLIESVRRTFRWVRLTALEEKFDGTLTSFAEGLSAISSPGHMLILLSMTAPIWATEVALVWGLAGSLGIALTLRSAMVASAVLGLGLMIPAAPGGLGTYELFGTEAFKLVGVAASGALALTIVIHAWVFVANIAIGLGALAIKGLSLAQLKDRLKISPVVKVANGAPPSRRAS